VAGKLFETGQKLNGIDSVIAMTFLMPALIDTWKEVFDRRWTDSQY
jgi:hypothetical protein